MWVDKNGIKDNGRVKRSRKNLREVGQKGGKTDGGSDKSDWLYTLISITWIVYLVAKLEAQSCHLAVDSDLGFYVAKLASGFAEWQ